MARTKPPNATPWFLLNLSVSAAIGGFLFGYDTGVVSGAMILLKKDFNLSPVWQEAIVSITVGAAAIFALIGGFTTDRWGRRPVIFAGSVLFTIGAILLAAANGKELLLIGRFIVGGGIGMSKAVTFC